MIVLIFIIVACTRVMQSYSSRKTALSIHDTGTFLKNGIYGNCVASVLALILFGSVCAFQGISAKLIMYGALTGLSFAIDNYLNIMAVKNGASLVLMSMVGTGGSVLLFCIASIFLYGEAMSVMQWIGLAVFLAAMFFLTSGSKQSYSSFSLKALAFLIASMIVQTFVLCFQTEVGRLSAGGEAKNEILALIGGSAPYTFLALSLEAAIFGVAYIVYLWAKGKRKADDAAEENAGTQTRKEFLPKPLYLYGALTGLALIILNVLLPVAMYIAPKVMVTTISSVLSLVVSLIVGAICFKEKITAKNIAGFALSVVAIVFIVAL